MELRKALTRNWAFGEFFAFALLGFAALYFMAPFHSSLQILLVLSLPLLAVFVLPSATRTCISDVADLVKSISWWHYLWFLVLLSGLVFRVRDVQDINANPLDAWAIFRVSVESVVALFLFIRLVDNETPWARAMFRGLIGFLTVFVFISLTSTAWSIKPIWTLYKSLEYGVDLALLAAVTVTLTSAEYRDLLNWTWTLIGFLLVTVWIGAVVDRRDALLPGTESRLPIPQLSGVLPVLASNTVGEFSAILGIVALCRILLNTHERSNRRWNEVVLAFSIITMFFAQTRTAIAGFLLGTLLLLFFTRHILLGILLSLTGAVAAMLTDSAQTVLEYLMRGQSAEEAQKLSSRVEWWQFAWHMFLQRPLIGWGGFAGGRFLILKQLNRVSTPDLHSSIIETLVDTGVFGLLFLILALFGAGWYLYRGARSSRLENFETGLAVECLAVLAVLSVRCIFSATLISHPALPFLAVLGYAEILRRQLKYGGSMSA